MNPYYLIAQLPSLDALSETAPLPITEARFSELCDRFLGKKACTALHALTLTPPKERATTQIALLDTYYEQERHLRLALAHLRAAKVGNTYALPQNFDLQDGDLWQTVRTAIDCTDPMEAERILFRYRLALLEALRPSDPFSEATVFYYALKLKLSARMRHFDKEAGCTVYQNIYASVLRGGEGEETA